jgi:predicted RNase H-like nuclease (RuvC/YqgF family)
MDAKRALMLAYIHRSGVAHTLKDLQKALPSIGSINAMAVQDYVNQMVDESEITVEKIGSGNWYWSFVGAEGEKRRAILDQAQEDFDKLSAEIQECETEFQAKKAEMMALDEDAEERKSAEEKVEKLANKAKALTEELKRYADDDPVEMERKKKSIWVLKKEVERHTEHIEGMEGWMRKNMGMDRESLRHMKMQFYGDEYDQEEQGLRQLL